VVRRHTIIAPLSTLTRFCQPPYGIPCFLEAASSIPSSRFKCIFKNQWISFNIGEVKNGRYPVNFAGTSVDGVVAQKLKKIVGERRECWRTGVLLGSSRSQVGVVDGVVDNTAPDYGGARPRERYPAIQQGIQQANVAPLLVPEGEVVHVPQQAIQPATAAPIPVPAPPPVQQPRTGGGIENVRELIYRFFCRHLKVSPEYTSTRDENSYSHRVSITVAGN
jgi:hypothetical protein